MIGGNNPRKNAIFVINQIVEIEKLGLKLVIINHNDVVFNSLPKSGYPSIIYITYLDTASYYSLIKYAKALLYPSLYEGFGIPILKVYFKNTSYMF
ncbi:MAG: hypothetical protein IPH32_17970 [Bacteroidetes bacterium]|nr:hypothetical protein [Bacteroidota bacterium]